MPDGEASLHTGEQHRRALHGLRDAPGAAKPLSRRRVLAGLLVGPTQGVVKVIQLLASFDHPLQGLATMLDRVSLIVFLLFLINEAERVQGNPECVSIVDLFSDTQALHTTL